MSHMFNNTTYSDFRTAHKHILIPTYIIQGIWEQNVTKLNISWLFISNIPRSKFEIEPSKPYFIYFIFKSLFLFDKKPSKPQANIHGKSSLSPPRHSFFLTHPFFKIWDWKLFLPAERRRGDTSISETFPVNSVVAGFRKWLPQFPLIHNFIIFLLHQTLGWKTTLTRWSFHFFLLHWFVNLVLERW